MVHSGTFPLIKLSEEHGVPENQENRQEARKTKDQKVNR